MSKLRVFLALAISFLLVVPAALAAQDPQVNLKVEVEKVAKQQARQQIAQNGNGGNGSGGGPADPNDAPDPAYLAEIQAIDGKKMTVRFTNAAPEIDGHLNDPDWNFADPVTDFLQREPDNGQPGSERTEVRMLYDGESIYFAFMMYDSEPSRIIAQDLRRDSRMDADDTIEVILDTFHDRRNGYIFRVNALSTMYDAELRNESRVNADWDEKWEAVSRITDEGWVAEVKIPLRALRYQTGSRVWGIDFKRAIRRKNEEVNWSNYRRGFRFNSISQGGNLVGLENLGLTQRFRFQPYVTGSGSQFNSTEEPFSEAAGSLGIENFKVQITPNLTADTTFNTDFAQVEDDSERVNLTRFPLFFPEKRDFFIESADSFSVGGGGGRGFGGFGGGGHGGGTNLFHSRNIGLVEGEPVPIIYGAKLTGKVGSTNIGLMNVQTDDVVLELEDETFAGPGENFTAIRLKQDVFARSTIGMLLTNVQGGGEHNRVAGVDANFRFYDYLSISGQVAQMNDSGVDNNQYTGRFGAGWDSDQWNVSGSYERIDPDFDSDLGFIRRRDIQTQTYQAGWNPRPQWAPAVRQFRFSGSMTYVEDIEGEILTREQSLTLSTNFQSGDRVTVNYGTNFERLDETFFLTDEIFVSPGDYSYNTWWVNYSSFNARKISGRVSASGGGFWDGTKYSVSPSATFRFNEKFSLSPGWNFNRVSLPTGSFDTHVITTRTQYNFNETWLTNSLIQYNTQSGRVSIYARLRMVYNTIDNFYLVYKNTTFYGDSDFYGVSDHQLIAKLTYSLDF